MKANVNVHPVRPSFLHRTTNSTICPPNHELQLVFWSIIVFTNPLINPPISANIITPRVQSLTSPQTTTKKQHLHSMPTMYLEPITCCSTYRMLLLFNHFISIYGQRTYQVISLTRAAIIRPFWNSISVNTTKVAVHFAKSAQLWMEK